MPHHAVAISPLRANPIARRAAALLMSGAAAGPAATVPSFDTTAFVSRLGSGTWLGRRIDRHESVPSTMPLADERLRAEGAAAHGSVILAEAQTAGVGRRGRSWLSAPLGNLYFSLLWAPPHLQSAGGGGGGVAAAFPEMAKLNLAASIAVVGSAVASGIAPAPRIKWPNDVWASASGGSSRAKKLSGMIVNFDGRSGAVLGVGINVHQQLAANETATSLATLRDAMPADARPPPVSREAVLASFCDELQRLMALPTSEVLAEYRRFDMLEGSTIRVHHKTREEEHPDDYDATALGVDEQGMLRVREVGGGAVKVLSGEEVSISPLLGGEARDEL